MYTMPDGRIRVDDIVAYSTPRMTPVVRNVRSTADNAGNKSPPTHPNRNFVQESDARSMASDTSVINFTSLPLVLITD